MIATVLVVDDDAMVRRLAARMLTLECYYVLEAASGELALRTLQRLASRVQLVLTDLAMPGIDGRSLGGVISRCWPDVCVLYTSGYPAVRMLDAGALEPGWPFIQKPFTAEQLSRKVRELLGTGGRDGEETLV
jgi:two-component system cell cycle sensor histidine kinase/response regulator CckA